MEMKDLIKQLLREGTFGDTSVDRNIDERIFRIMGALGANGNDLGENLQFLVKPTKYVGSDDVKKCIAAITLLETLQQLIQEFDGSSAGFLFESFIAGLMGGRVIEGNKPSDIILPGAKEGKGGIMADKFYQTKLYGGTGGDIRLANWFNPEKTGEYTRSDVIIFGLKGDKQVTVYKMDVEEYVRSKKSYKQKYAGVDDFFEFDENELVLRPKEKDSNGVEIARGEKPKEKMYKTKDEKGKEITDKKKYNEDLKSWEEINKRNYDLIIPIKALTDVKRRSKKLGVINEGEIKLNITALRALGQKAQKIAFDSAEQVYKSLTNFTDALTEMVSGIEATSTGSAERSKTGGTSAVIATKRLNELDVDFKKTSKEFGFTDEDYDSYTEQY
jgi:hypothetical protein